MMIQNRICSSRASAVLAAFLFACFAAFFINSASAAPPKPTGHPASSCAPGVEFLGFSDALDKERFEDTNVGGLSAITAAKGPGAYHALVDNEGNTPARFYYLRVPKAAERPEVRDVTILRDASGEPFTGRNFDGEGMAKAKNGDLFISSETEPSIRRFGRDGSLLEELSVPRKFLVAPEGEAEPNQTFESLAITKDGRNLFTATEGPLLSDGETAEGEARVLRYEKGRGSRGFVPAEEYFYLAESGQGVVEVISLDRDELLVMERGFVSGEGNTVRVFRVSLAGAEDVSDEPSLAASEPVEKELLFDLADCPPSGAESPGEQSNPLLDNFEAMAFGERLPGGKRELLLVSDDNFNDAQVTRVISLGVDLREKKGPRH